MGYLMGCWWMHIQNRIVGMSGTEGARSPYMIRASLSDNLYKILITDALRSYFEIHFYCLFQLTDATNNMFSTDWFQLFLHIFDID